MLNKCLTCVFFKEYYTSRNSMRGIFRQTGLPFYTSLISSHVGWTIIFETICFENIKCNIKQLTVPKIKVQMSHFFYNIGVLPWAPLSHHIIFSQKFWRETIKSILVTFMFKKSKYLCKSSTKKSVQNAMIKWTAFSTILEPPFFYYKCHNSILGGGGATLWLPINTSLFFDIHVQNKLGRFL